MLPWAFALERKPWVLRCKTQHLWASKPPWSSPPQYNTFEFRCYCDHSPSNANCLFYNMKATLLSFDATRNTENHRCTKQNQHCWVSMRLWSFTLEWPSSVLPSKTNTFEFRCYSDHFPLNENNHFDKAKPTRLSFDATVTIPSEWKPWVIY